MNLIAAEPSLLVQLDFQGWWWRWPWLCIWGWKQMWESGGKLVLLPGFGLFYTSLQLLNIQSPVPWFVEVVTHLDGKIESCKKNHFNHWPFFRFIPINVMWKQNKQIVKLSDRKLKLCQRSRESLHILWLEQKLSDLFHVIFRQACTVKWILGNGNHDPRSSRACPLRVRHQLHHCADSLACSCGRGDEDDDEDDFTNSSFVSTAYLYCNL